MGWAQQAGEEALGDRGREREAEGLRGAAWRPCGVPVPRGPASPMRPGARGSGESPPQPLSATWGCPSPQGDLVGPGPRSSLMVSGRPPRPLNHSAIFWPRTGRSLAPLARRLALGPPALVGSCWLCPGARSAQGKWAWGAKARTRFACLRELPSHFDSITERMILRAGPARPLPP